MKLQWLEGRGWRVTTPIPFKGGEVPVGFTSDGITLPLPTLKWVVDPQGKALKAAIIHDWCYLVQGMSRKEADILFKETMVANGVNKVRAQLMYLGVRVFGKWYWDELSQAK